MQLGQMLELLRLVNKNLHLEMALAPQQSEVSVLSKVIKAKRFKVYNYNKPV